MQSYMSELGWPTCIEIKVDATAAQAIASRQGIGKIRHLSVRHLWLQALVRRGAVSIRRVPGQVNPSDALTKIMSHEVVKAKLALVNVFVE